MLIVDESHDAKNEKSLLNNALRSLQYHYAFLLTGRPMYNTWKYLLGQTLLLPYPTSVGRKYHTPICPFHQV
ncbi:hypothetical protein B0J13DRAFT_553781 [Dactylonectria estremocensis]|uniref:SNF2 N-terminal domain-containing protein n=1 Tax=Dactylonectria estremocensis TaxID=1079267 RepID=A0A9P9EW15_9HYPO|nr:hypothetical protein B0J13DRAFT_553781 [Dactylonectria estremocensis]